MRRAERFGMRKKSFKNTGGNEKKMFESEKMRDMLWNERNLQNERNVHKANNTRSNKRLNLIKLEVIFRGHRSFWEHFF